MKKKNNDSEDLKNTLICRIRFYNIGVFMPKLRTMKKKKKNMFLMIHIRGRSHMKSAPRGGGGESADFRFF